MRYPLKLDIRKKVILGEYRTPWYTLERIQIDDASPIKTEAQLAYYIYLNHGLGRFIVLAYQKPIKGFWCFWIGEIYEQGYLRDISRGSKEIDKLKKDLHQADSYQEREEIEEEIGFERDISSMEKKYKRRGPIGLIKTRPGQMHPYEEF